MDTGQTAPLGVVWSCRVHIVCLYAKIGLKTFARIFSRRHKQTTFSDAGFLGVLRARFIMFANDHIWVQCVRRGGGGWGSGGRCWGLTQHVWNMDGYMLYMGKCWFYDRFHHTPIWITRQLSKQDIGQLICQGPILYDRMSTVTPYPSCDLIFIQSDSLIQIVDIK